MPGNSERLLGLALLALVLTLGCAEARRNRERTEAAKLDRALSELRDADNHGKRAGLDGLRAVACSAADLCELKQVCLEAYTGHVTAVERIDRLRLQLASPLPSAAELSSPVRTGAGLELDAARKELERARGASVRCAELQAMAQAHYELH